MAKFTPFLNKRRTIREGWGLKKKLIEHICKVLTDTFSWLLRTSGRADETAAGRRSDSHNWLRPDESNRRLSQSPSSSASPAVAATLNSHEGSASPRPSGIPWRNSWKKKFRSSLKRALVVSFRNSLLSISKLF
jgi:hypothetical protein